MTTSSPSPTPPLPSSLQRPPIHILALDARTNTQPQTALSPCMPRPPQLVATPKARGFMAVWPGKPSLTPIVPSSPSLTRKARRTDTAGVLSESSRKWPSAVTCRRGAGRYTASSTLPLFARHPRGTLPALAGPVSIYCGHANSCCAVICCHLESSGASLRGLPSDVRG